MQSSPHGILLVFDHELTYRGAGGHGLPASGLSREEVEGRSIFEVLPPDTLAEVEGLYRAALRGRSTVLDVDFAGRTFSLRVGPLSDSAGQILGGVAATEDVTEVRAAEHALGESSERSRLSFEHAPIGQALVELDGRFRQVNTAFTRLTGYPEKQLLDMTFQDITHPDDLAADLQHAAELLAGEIDAYELEKRYVTAPGDVVWVLLSVALVRDEAGVPLYFIAQVLDITERKQSHEALRDLIGMLAHDLRTPAAIITGYTDLMLSSYDDSNDEERRGSLRRIAAAGHRLTALLDNTLTVSTLDAKGPAAAPTTVDVARAVHDVLETLADALPTVDLTRLAPAPTWMDPGHLTHVVCNVVTNAIMYGGGTIAFTVQEEQNEVLLSISDDGPGVPPDFVPHLFDRFSRAEDSRGGGDRGTGLGLGLYIVRSLLELNGARIWYDDTPGGGATFTMALPQPATGPDRAGHDES